VIRPFRDQLAAVYDGKPVRQAVGFFKILRGKKHRRAFRRDGADEVPDLVPAPWIKARCGLVQEEQVGGGHEARGNVQPAPHSAGERPHLAPSGLRQAGRIEKLIRPGPRAAPRKTQEAADQHEVLPAGEVLVHGRELARQADLGPDRRACSTAGSVHPQSIQSSPFAWAAFFSKLELFPTPIGLVYFPTPPAVLF